MKVRITHDTIRIRLTQSETRQLGDGGSIQMLTPFAGGAQLIAILRPAAVKTIAASMQPFSLVIDIPESQVAVWAESDAIALESRPTDGAAGPTIIVEKDFHCLHRDTADDADTFPNPKQR